MRKKRKVKVGRVVSDRMNKTRVVSWEEKRIIPIYKKSVKRRVKVKVHDEENISKSGDRVKIMETKPLSKEKNWRIIEIIGKINK